MKPHSEYDWIADTAFDGVIAIVSQDRLFREALSVVCEQEGRLKVVALEDTISGALPHVQVLSGTGLIVDFDSLPSYELSLLPGLKAVGVVTIAITSAHKDPKTPLPFNVTKMIAKRESKEKFLKLVKNCLPKQSSGPLTVQEERSAYQITLTTREVEVAKLISKGFSNQRIAQTLLIHEQSVKNIASGLMRKLRCSNRVQVALSLKSLLSGGRITL